uniref:GLTSCR protein conserved domain-containing protein n=1 Tax=Ananas comosus var. bracteatus TaxID=296719 RepID=A0A6V7QCT2_ANACO|nr:unnamed protein product [Ananas comosus var. bracteatus]
MDDGANNAAALAAQQQLLLQQHHQQIFLFQQQQQQQQNHQTHHQFPQPQQQLPKHSFRNHSSSCTTTTKTTAGHLPLSSNMTPTSAPGFRSSTSNPTTQPKPKRSPRRRRKRKRKRSRNANANANAVPIADAGAAEPGGGGDGAAGRHEGVQPRHQDPFASIEDALLPYHVVSDYEAEEDDRILDSDVTGQVNSRLQQWDHNILVKIAEFTTTFEKQVLAFNIMTRKRALGEFRSEERLMLEQALLQEEKQSLLELRAEIESREKAGRMAMAQAEQAHRVEMMARGPMRGSAATAPGEDGSLHNNMGQYQGGNEEEIQGWGNGQRDDEEPSEDFLNDENENENGETAMQDDWREAGELDLNNSR